MNCARWGSPDYHGLLKDALDAIAHRLERDFGRSERENNYIIDDTAKNLKSAVSELERCGISTGSTGSKIEKPAWFVNGDPAEIRQLQSKLNQLGIGEHLAEDGVYGKKTMTALETYIKTFGMGSLPVAGVMNPQLGKKTLSTAASIGGSWAGSTLGAKGGAMLGALRDQRSFLLLGQQSVESLAGSPEETAVIKSLSFMRLRKRPTADLPGRYSFSMEKCLIKWISQ